MKMSREEFLKVLELHKKYLADEEDGEMAFLTGRDLSGSAIDEDDVNLSFACLYYANLNHVRLPHANFANSDLSFSSMVDAVLAGADFTNCDLTGVNMTDSSLLAANFKGVKRFEGLNLYGADLRKAKNIPEGLAASLMACPEEGSFIAWKKVRYCSTIDEYIIKLLVPEDAKRSSATTRKCRCSKAKVLDIQNLDGTSAEITEYAHNVYGHTTLYKIGEMVYPDSFDEDRWNECSHGIHFFITRQEAVEY